MISANESPQIFSDAIPFIMEGQVVDTSDPDQMGRVRVWIPALDGENFIIDRLPWADYASPLFGYTVEYPAGGGTSKNGSHAAYGFWAIPKIGASVLVFCLNADPQTRFYFASSIRLHRNRSMPAGRNVDLKGNIGPFGDTVDESNQAIAIQPAYSNLRDQFQNKMTSSQAQSRGAYERQVGQALTDKDGKEGYSPNAADPSYLDPQTYCFVTPGRHALIMQDDPKFSRLRIKTAEGHQVIFDDANERIYMSTAKGKSWVEMDLDGHIHIFGSDSISFRSGKDINFFADGNINMEAQKAVNIKADKSDIKISTGGSLHVKAFGSILQSACNLFEIDAEVSVHVTGAANVDIKAGAGAALTGGSAVDIRGGASIRQTAGRIDLNGPGAREAVAAQCPDQADSPSIVPGHEPWDRPASPNKRGPNWKA